MSDQKEVEIKFRVDDLEPVRRRLAELGAKDAGRAHEENLVFDDSDGRLRASGELLRLRRDRQSLLTFKAPIPDARFKVRREVQVEVSDFTATRALLEALGFQAVRRYAKERETWHYEGVEVLLDELYFGRFVEMEGPEESIERVARRLGFDLSQGITRDYLALEDEDRSRKADV